MTTSLSSLGNTYLEATANHEWRHSFSWMGERIVGALYSQKSLTSQSRTWSSIQTLLGSFRLGMMSRGIGWEQNVFQPPSETVSSGMPWSQKNAECLVSGMSRCWRGTQFFQAIDVSILVDLFETRQPQFPHLKHPPLQWICTKALGCAKLEQS